MLSAGITASGLEDRIGMGGQVTSTSWEGHIKSSTANSSGASWLTSDSKRSGGTTGWLRFTQKDVVNIVHTTIITTTKQSSSAH